MHDVLVSVYINSLFVYINSLFVYINYLFVFASRCKGENFAFPAEGFAAPMRRVRDMERRIAKCRSEADKEPRRSQNKKFNEEMKEISGVSQDLFKIPVGLYKFFVCLYTCKI